MTLVRDDDTVAGHVAHDQRYHRTKNGTRPTELYVKYNSMQFIKLIIIKTIKQNRRIRRRRTRPDWTDTDGRTEFLMITGLSRGCVRRSFFPSLFFLDFFLSFIFSSFPLYDDRVRAYRAHVRACARG